MKYYVEKYVQVLEFAEKDAAWIKYRGESRTKLYRYREGIIRGWKLPKEDKDRLVSTYEKEVLELAPVVRKHAPIRPRIAVSTI